MAAMVPGSGDSSRRVDLTVRLPALTSHVTLPLPSFRRDAPSTKQHRSRSRSRSRSPALISSEPRSWTSLFKAPIGSPDLRLKFFAPKVQAEKMIVVYEIADSAELIKTWSMMIVGCMIGLKTSYFLLSSFIKNRWGTSAFYLHMLENDFFICKLYSKERFAMGP
ncbi:unnamed protein product [Musa acuminata var. zebrina]